MRYAKKVSLQLRTVNELIADCDNVIKNRFNTQQGQGYNHYMRSLFKDKHDIRCFKDSSGVSRLPTLHLSGFYNRDAVDLVNYIDYTDLIQDDINSVCHTLGKHVQIRSEYFSMNPFNIGTSPLDKNYYYKIIHLMPLHLLNDDIELCTIATI